VHEVHGDVDAVHGELGLLRGVEVARAPRDRAPRAALPVGVVARRARGHRAPERDDIVLLREPAHEALPDEARGPRDEDPHAGTVTRGARTRHGAIQGETRFIGMQQAPRADRDEAPAPLRCTSVRLGRAAAH